MNLFTQSVIAFEPDYMAGTILSTTDTAVTRKMSALVEPMFSWSGESHTINKSTDTIPGSGNCYGEKQLV